MEKPTDEQLADAIIESARAGESEAEFEERIADLHRLTDEELAAMGIVPRTEELAELSRNADSSRTCKTVNRVNFGDWKLTL